MFILHSKTKALSFFVRRFVINTQTKNKNLLLSFFTFRIGTALLFHLKFLSYFYILNRNFNSLLYFSIYLIDLKYCLRKFSRFFPVKYQFSLRLYSVILVNWKIFLLLFANVTFLINKFGFNKLPDQLTIFQPLKKRFNTYASKFIKINIYRSYIKTKIKN